MEDTDKYLKFPNAYPVQYPGEWSTEIFRLPDIAISEPEVGIPGALGRNTEGTKIYIWDGLEWIEISGGGGGSTSNKMEVINFTTETILTIDWTTTRQANFGSFPLIQVWQNSPVSLINVPIDADAAPGSMTQLTVYLPGFPGFIIIK